MHRDAVFSGGGKYRYTLGRAWDSGERGLIMWVMLNPSTADATKDDATITRVVNFSKAWGFEAAVVVNLYAWRATKPTDLWAAAKSGENIIGPKNDKWITKEVHHAQRIICAWGGNADFQRPKDVLGILAQHRKKIWTLGHTTSGHPLHPLRLSSDTHPTSWDHTKASDGESPKLKRELITPTPYDRKQAG